MANDEYHCAKCKTTIISRAKLHCSNCENLYHLECGNVSSKRYYLMTKEHRTQWKCNYCYEEQHQALPTTSTNTVLESPYANVTQRKKFVINVSTGNSYSSLSVEDEEDSDTYQTPRTLLNRSCPSLQGMHRYHLDEMKEKISQLQQQIDIAENEISNLLSENHDLGKKVTKYEVKIKQLETICGCMKPVSPSSLPSTIKKTRKSLNKKALNFLECENNILDETTLLPVIKGNNSKESHEVQSNEKEVYNKLTHKTVPLTSSPQKKCTIETTDFDLNNDVKLKGKKHNVIVFGDEYGKGINTTLQKLLGHDFQVMSIIKPNAPLNQILKYCDVICKDFTDFDYVVLLAGSNDNNPLRFQSFIYYYLTLLTHTNVLVSEVYKNKHLNERKQNNSLRMVCAQFLHVRFIETYQFKYNKLYISQSLLREILNINFSVKYKYYMVEQTEYIGKSDIPQNHVSLIKCPNSKPLGNKLRQLKIIDFFTALPNVKNVTPVLNESSCLKFFRA